MDILLMTVIAGPLLVGVALPAAARFRAAALRSDRAAVVPLVIAALSTLGLVVLLSWAGSDLALSVQWLPGTGRMVIGLGATGLYVALATTGACALALWGARAVRSHWMGALTLLAVAAAQVAFLAEHFLARYVALEFVALCVALAPLIELRPAQGAGARGAGTGGGQVGGGLARLVYLILRLGDVGLLAAILVLWSAGGTLEIVPALAAAQSLDPVRLSWAASGFCLAVWVKVGGWPVHVWQQVGERLSLFSHSWLYATLMPNLGFYLLYRVTPLLVQAGGVQRAAYGIGAVGAALAAILALATARSRLRSTFVYLGAALGGLALVLAACGLKTVVWMTALVLTPLRLLLYLAAAGAPAGDAAWADPTAGWLERKNLRRAIGAGLYALSGLALTGYCLLCAWWVRQAGAPPAVRLVSECAVAAIGIWAVRSTWSLWRPPIPSDLSARRVPASRRLYGPVRPAPSSRPADDPQAEIGRRPPGGIPACALLGAIVLAGMLGFGSLARHLSAVAHDASLPLPTALDLARYLATTPMFWVTALLAVVAWRYFFRPRRVSLDAAESAAPGFQAPYSRALNLEEGLAQAAQILSAVVEVGIQERILGGIVRAVLGGARAMRRVIEQRILGGGIQLVSDATVAGGRLAYRVLEQEGLEGLLRGAVRAVLAGGRWMQRWQTGRLRRNLIWVAASLLLALVALALSGW